MPWHIPAGSQKPLSEAFAFLKAFRLLQFWLPASISLFLTHAISLPPASYLFCGNPLCMREKEIHCNSLSI